LQRRHFLPVLLVPQKLATAFQSSTSEPHFPSRLHQFVWRNWELANVDRMAAVMRTSPRNVLKLGESMGLPPKPRLTPDQLRRIYVTVIRQNWHLLPEDQIIALLGWTPEKFAFTLKEDDFLDHKLGRKPRCEPVLYREPDAPERAAAARIRKMVREELGDAIRRPGEEPFAFVAQLSERSRSRARSESRHAAWDPRFIYSYFALYGDPLLETGLDPFPDGYLEKLAACGVNGVWIQAVLNSLAPSKSFPEFGAGSETRLRNLNALVERAARFGVKVWLYLNEPRAMAPDFFAKHPEIRGSSSGGLHAMCTSVPAVREWIADSLARVVRHVPALGGFFSITMSENHTNCFSHGGAWGTGAPNAGDCPRCQERKSWDAIGELIQTMRDGVRRESATVDLIVWDWGWGDALAAHLIPLLPRDVRFQSISEWQKPVDRGGVKTAVGEYSISVTGPGPRASRNWALARERGLSTVAKVQFNNTWEISAVPYIPVPHLILEHCAGLAKAGISGLMLSWTCGGYPSPNLEAAQAYYTDPRPSHDEILTAVAERRYGAAAAPRVVEAWRRFSEAFREFPYGVAIYTIPTQHGPANLLRLRATGSRASMILFPHDDWKSWCGAYPPAAVVAQFRKLSEKWQEGLAVLRAAGGARAELVVAETCYNHFRSTANQVEFYMAREKGDRGKMRELAQDELNLAKAQYQVARGDSTIAYEASNHYYYRPLDLVEKILNCRRILEEL
jgi:hypothetical protein